MNVYIYVCECEYARVCKCEFHTRKNKKSKRQNKKFSWHKEIEYVSYAYIYKYMLTLHSFCTLFEFLEQTFPFLFLLGNLLGELCSGLLLQSSDIG